MGDIAILSETKLFLSLLAPRGPPLNVTAQNVSSTGIKVTWQLIEEKVQYGIILGYRIRYKKGASAAELFRRKRRSIELQETEVLGGNNLTWTLEGLEKFTNYCIQVLGFNSKGDGNMSDSICVMTDEDGERYIISLNLRSNQKVLNYSLSAIILQNSFVLLS